MTADHRAERSVRAPTDTDLDSAWETVRERLAPTPLVQSALAGEAWLKLETFQPTGAFKVRGALAALSALPEGARAVTASAGNHGLGMAYAASVTGSTVTVVVSEHASPSKVAALRAYPIELVQHGRDYDEAEAHALSLATSGATYVSAYNDPMVIAGQATIGRELDEQAPGELTVVTPVGGGGLAAGLALWARRRGGVRLVGVEACASRAVSMAIRAGHVAPVEVGDTLADGLAGNIEPGCVTPQVIGADTELTCVTEDQLRAGMRWLFTRHGLVAEGAGAAAVAAVLAGLVRPSGRLVVLITGRNITPASYCEALREE